jgi:hypothetical protein
MATASRRRDAFGGEPAPAGAAPDGAPAPADSRRSRQLFDASAEGEALVGP